MNKQINLSDDELDAAVGGMMKITAPNNGRTHGGSNGDDWWVNAALGLAFGGIPGLIASFF